MARPRQNGSQGDVKALTPKSRGSTSGPEGGVQKKPLAKQGGKLRSVKNQIRAIQRLLQKGGLAPKAAAQQEKRLEQLKDALEGHKKSELERKNATKYHKVRFFERRKIERRIARLEKQPADELPEAAADRAKQLAALREDLQYVVHFPKGEKYVSLLRQAEEPEAQAQLEAERARLRAVVRARVADAALIAEPDEGRSLAAAADGQAEAEVIALDSEQDDFFLASDDETPAGTVDLPSSRTAPQQNAAMLASSSEEEDLFQPDRMDRPAVRPEPGSEPAKSAGKPGKRRQLGSSRSAAGSSKQQQPRGKPGPLQHGRQAAAIKRKEPDAAEPLPTRPQCTRHPQSAAGNGQTQHRVSGRTLQPAAAKQRLKGSPHANATHQSAGSGKQAFRQHSNSRPPPAARQVAKPAAQKGSKPPAPEPEEPLRTRAEGGRKRRKKK